jgi:hypothetical protein
MIEMRRIQLSFGDGLVAEEVSNLRETAGRIDVFGDRRRADEAGRHDARVVQQRVDRSLSPLTTLRMPDGSPASIMSWPSRIGTEGSRSDGLRMKALPQAMAGANFHIGIIAGSHGGLGVSMHPNCTRAGGTRPSPGDQPAIARRAAFQFHGRIGRAGTAIVSEIGSVGQAEPRLRIDCLSSGFVVVERRPRAGQAVIRPTYDASRCSDNLLAHRRGSQNTITLFSGPNIC